MKLTASVLLSGLALVAAQSSVSDIGNKLTEIKSSVEKLNSGVTSFNGDSSGSLALVDASSAIDKTLKEATKEANSLGQVSQEDAVGLVQPIKDLDGDVKMLVDSLVSKKDTFVGAGLGDVVHSALQAAQSGSEDLAKALISKLPTSLQNVAGDLAKPINDNLARGVAAYAGTGVGSGGKTPKSSAPAMPMPMSSSAPERPAATPAGYGGMMSSAASSPAMGAATPTTYGGAVTPPVGGNASNMTNATSGYTPQQYTGKASMASCGVLVAAALVAIGFFL